MAIVISGSELSKHIKEDLKQTVNECKTKYGRIPHLAVILVGNDVGSISYVRGKEKAATQIGIKNTTIRLDDKVSEKTVLDLVDSLNDDESVDGILVQLPLPKHIDEEKVISRVSSKKDVDGFHPTNVAKLWLKNEAVLPCTPKGIMKLIKSIGCDLKGKHVCIMGRSHVVGLPVSKLLLDSDATVSIVHSKTLNPTKITSQADILIVAIGRPKYVTADFLKPGAIVIDVGVNRDIETKKLCGDVDFDDCFDKASYITKVPGGVGPMTISCLLENTVELFLKHIKE